MEHIPQIMAHSLIRNLKTVAAVCCIAAGCGGADPSPQPPPKSETAPSANEPDDRAPEASTTSVASADQRTRWLDDIPYDAFYDRPLDVYRDGDRTASVAPASDPVSLPVPDKSAAATDSTGEPATTTAAVPGDSAASASSSIRWDRVVPMDVLVAETKVIRTRLAANLQTVATYNANIEAIETDGSVLALLAAIIERHPGELTWKDRAPHVRQLAYDIYLNASGRGRVQFQAAKTPFEKIVTIWDGGPPPDADVEPQAALGEAGDRARVMQCIDRTFKSLRSDVNTASRMKEDLDQVLQETAVMVVLGTALKDPSFDDADQEAYRALLQQFIDGHQAMSDAAKADDFERFEQARDSVQKSCDACHLEYRTRSSDE